MRNPRETVKAWLELLRIPNLFTVPGDPLMGFFLGFLMFHETNNPAPLYSFLGLPLVLISSLLFYGFGLVINDLQDLEDDSYKRPERPLPSGRIPVKQALHAAVLMAAAGLFLCGLCGFRPFFTAILLVLTIILYNRVCKRNVFFAPLTMGLCRGLNILLGVSLLPVVSLLPIICIFLLESTYIFSVTLIARFENRKVRFKVLGWLPCFCGAFFYLLFAVLILAAQVKTNLILSKFLFFIAVLVFVISTFSVAKELTHLCEPKVIQKNVGKLIRNLILMQCSILFFCGTYGVIAGVILMAGLIPCSILSAKYKGS